MLYYECGGGHPVVYVKKATESDLTNILNIIKKTNQKEKHYLRYPENTDNLIERLTKNIKEQHVLLFTTKQYNFGFIEYTVVSNNNTLWVFSLYFEPAYRTFEYLKWIIIAYRGLVQSYQLPICYTVHEDNKPMRIITRYIRGKELSKDAEGFIKVRVDVEDTI